MKLLAVLLFCAASVAQELNVRTLVFDSESSQNYVTLKPLKPLDLSSFTLCLRVATELPQLQREIILFSYRTQDADELNLWRGLDGRIVMYLSGDGVFFTMPALGPTETHLCITWDSQSGATTVFVDGKKSLTKFYKKNHRVRGGGKVLIGQDPDEYLGNFDANQYFVGEISDINLWSYVVPRSVIKQMATGYMTQFGDIIDWKEVQFSSLETLSLLLQMCNAMKNEL